MVVIGGGGWADKNNLRTSFFSCRGSSGMLPREILRNFYSLINHFLARELRGGGVGGFRLGLAVGIKVSAVTSKAFRAELRVES